MMEARPAVVTIADNVRAQHQLLTEVFDVQRLYSTVLGFTDLDACFRGAWIDEFSRAKAAGLYAEAVTWL